jgi:hypothetical protein
VDTRERTAFSWTTVETGARVRSLAFYPVDAWPAGVAFGGVSTASTTTLTVRTRRRGFDPAAVAALLHDLVTAATGDR